jgi:hypothetical protein
LKELQQVLDALIAAPKVDKAAVEALVGQKLAESARNPHWVYFLGKGEGELIEIDFRQSLSEDAWLLAFQFDPAKSRTRASFDFGKYGHLASLDPNPAIPPEGVVSYVYRCNGLRLSFSFTSRTQKLRDAVLRKDPTSRR